MKSYGLNSPSFKEGFTPEEVANKLLECVRKDSYFFQHLQIALDRLYKFHLLEPVRCRSSLDFAREIQGWNICSVHWSWKTGYMVLHFRDYVSQPYQNLSV